MLRALTAAVAVIVLLLFDTVSLSAQIDYRNLDAGRPVRTEDAYPIERYAFEFLVPYGAERAGGTTVHSMAPELEFGVARNAQVAVEVPVALERSGGRTDAGLGGLGVSGLYNFNSESLRLPALAVRIDASLPVGSLAGDRATIALTALLTRSWGLTRLHLNASRAWSTTGARAVVEARPRWWAGAAVDRTLFRQSVVLIGEVSVLDHGAATSLEVTAAAGVRYQWGPRTVVDLGLTRRLGAEGPDLGLALGLTRVFGIAGLLP